MQIRQRCLVLGALLITACHTTEQAKLQEFGEFSADDRPRVSGGPSPSGGPVTPVAPPPPAPGGGGALPPAGGGAGGGGAGGGGGTVATPVTIASTSLIRSDGMRIPFDAAPKPVGLSIEVVFSAAPDLPTIERDFRITGNGTPVVGTFIWSNNNTTLRFTPRSRLSFGFTYNVQLAAPAFAERFGTMVQGDVNGDGSPEIVHTRTGRIFSSVRVSYIVEVVSGATIANATALPLMQITSNAIGDGFGQSVALAGDVNGDGFEDIAVGSTGQNVPGTAYLFYGSQTPPTRLTPTQANVVLRPARGSNGDAFGGLVAGVGDLNGDGRDDLAVGAEFADGATAADIGQVTLFDGAGAILATFDGPHQGSSFGSAMLGPGDVTGDGLNDLLIGAPRANLAAPVGISTGGVVALYPGRRDFSGQLIPATSASLRIEAERGADAFGSSLAAIGDLNSDGVVDIAVGAPSAQNDAGAVFLFTRFVPTAAELVIAVTAPVLLSARTAAGRVNGGSPGDQLGYSIAGVGDVNADRIPDVAIGSYAYKQRSGLVGLFSSSQMLRSPLFSSALLQSAEGSVSEEWFGWALISMGDFTGDGISELIVGVPQATLVPHPGGLIRVVDPAVALRNRSFGGAAVLREIRPAGANDAVGLIVGGIGVRR